MRPKVFVNKHGSTILSIAGAAGVVGTAVLTVKSTTKANQILAQINGEELTTKDKVKLLAPIYIPPVAVGVATVGCILGANVLNKRAQQSIMSSYVLLDQTFKEYRDKVLELYGEEADKTIKSALEKEHCPRS